MSTVTDSIVEKLQRIKVAQLEENRTVRSQAILAGMERAYMHAIKSYDPEGYVEAYKIMYQSPDSVHVEPPVLEETEL